MDKSKSKPEKDFVKCKTCNGYIAKRDYLFWPHQCQKCTCIIEHDESNDTQETEKEPVKQTINGKRRRDPTPDFDAFMAKQLFGSNSHKTPSDDDDDEEEEEKDEKCFKCKELVPMECDRDYYCEGCDKLFCQACYFSQCKARNEDDELDDVAYCKDCIRTI